MKITIGDNIKYYRKLYSLNKNELTQEKLAEKLVLSQMQVKDMKNLLTLKCAELQLKD